MAHFELPGDLRFFILTTDVTGRFNNTSKVSHITVIYKCQRMCDYVIIVGQQIYATTNVDYFFFEVFSFPIYDIDTF